MAGLSRETASAVLRSGRSRRGRLAEIRALYLADLVHLEDVAFLHVVETLEQDPALEALLDLANVVLEPLQLRDRGLDHNRAVADHADLAAAANDTARDHAAGDRAQPRDPEERPDLGLAGRLLVADRPEHADERLLDLLGQLIDDAVRADLDALALGELAGLGVRAHVEADNEGVRGGGQVDVVGGDP